MDRYTPCAGYIGAGDYLGDTELHPEGDYVLYEDAMAEIERLREVIFLRLCTCGAGENFDQHANWCEGSAALRQAALRGEEASDG